MIEAIIFDLDGTLLDTLEDIAGPVNATLARHGLPTHPSSDYRYMVGNGFRNLLRVAMPKELVDTPMMERLIEEAQAAYAAAPVVKTAPYPGIPELLSALAERGLPRAVLSNKPDPLVQATVSILLPEAGFFLIRGESPAFPRKPDPAAALDIARRLGRAPESILYVGDSDVDMHTARNAGMVGLGAAWGFRGEEELRRAGASRIIHTPAEILDLLQQD